MLFRMCTNYKPSSRDHIREVLEHPESFVGDWPEETFRDYAAPIIRSDAGSARELLIASYSMIPKAHTPPAIKGLSTTNARAETIGQKPSYSKAWRQGQTCLIPTAWFYEPNYESGKAERWAIGKANESPFCVAGIWRQWDEEEGGRSYSFTQITINADEHPLMKRFHKPGDEKRSVVIVPESEYGAWLDCRDPELARSMLQLYPADLMKVWPAAKGYGRKNAQASLL